MDIPSECRIAGIDPDHAMILPHDANPGRLRFLETTGGCAAVGPITLLSLDIAAPNKQRQCRRDSNSCSAWNEQNGDRNRAVVMLSFACQCEGKWAEFRRDIGVNEWKKLWMMWRDTRLS
jgi:hypothetical protein